MISPMLNLVYIINISKGLLKLCGGHDMYGKNHIPRAYNVAGTTLTSVLNRDTPPETRRRKPKEKSKGDQKERNRARPTNDCTHES